MTEKDELSVNTKHKDFLRVIIDEDIRTNKYGGNVVTRFPPEPNGFLHIGHAKSICLNFGIANDYNGRCHLRFDDTDPTKEDMLYVNSIQEDVRWLGFDWNDNMFFASDYFEKLYDYAVQLIKMGKAYVCSLNEQEIREYRGTITESGKHSSYRGRSIEENLDLFTRMRAGEFKDGEHVLRAKIDMASPNMKMRDPLLYRIRHANHYRTGDNWCIYPMYDFAHCLSDYIEGITHSICTLEFENNRELYDWILDELELSLPRPYQYEFARLNLDYTVVSKRKLLELVEKKYVNGWDDPRLSTISGLRRRGCTPESIRRFCDSIGIAKANNNVDIAQFEFCIRDDLNQKVPRVLCVLRPLKVIIENYPDEQTEMIDAPYYPHDVPKEGSRKLPFSKVIYIERDDFMENPSKGFYRLSPGQEVRLRHAYIIRCEQVIKNANGEVVELRCTYDPATKSGADTGGKKVKGTIHWVAANQAKRVEVRLYDRLFSVPNPDTLDDVNPNSLEVLTDCYIEPAVVEEKLDVRYQFERQGYFYLDPIDSVDGKMVFNRIVQLKDSWTRAAKVEESKKEVKKPEVKQSAEVKQEAAVLTPEAEARLKRYQDNLGLNAEIADIIAKDADLSGFFEEVLYVYNNANSVGNFIANELSRELKDKNISELSFDAAQVAELVELIDKGTISWKIAKDIFEEMLEKGGSPKAIVESKGLMQISDARLLVPIIDKVIANNPENVTKYKEGRTNLLGFFVGQVMKQTGGKANPKLLNDLILEKLTNN
ncbi:MAG: glutamine--tRNA ligase/YqeY domain fusion protein [Candidatus Gastranaerophilales bacterium]|nr:glutamine--tRNA ligase/YqeY domain fusion protein [Candidatus Gastranaerophilales bacterium]